MSGVRAESAMLAVGEIVVGDRHRKDMGDIDTLMASIESVGLLHPIVLNEEGVLIAGGRRLEAIRRLGWRNAPVHFVENITDARQILEAERDENTCREEMKVSEKVALGRALEELERPKARARELAGVRPSENFTQGSEQTGKVRDIVGAALGVSGPTYQRAKLVIEAATDEKLPEEVRETAARAAGEMDRTGRVYGAYKRVLAAKKHAKNGTPKPKKQAAAKKGGPRINVPEGRTLESIAREAIDLEKQGATPSEAAGMVGLNLNTYRMARYIVVISDRPDLSGRDAGAAGRALTAMNAERRVSEPFALVEDLVARIYGPGNRSGGTLSVMEAHHRANFDRALGALTQICAATPHVATPHLSPVESAKVCAELKAAAQHIDNLRRRISEANR